MPFVGNVPSKVYSLKWLLLFNCSCSRFIVNDMGSIFMRDPLDSRLLLNVNAFFRSSSCPFISFFLGYKVFRKLLWYVPFVHVCLSQYTIHAFEGEKPNSGSWTKIL